MIGKKKQKGKKSHKYLNEDRTQVYARIKIEEKQRRERGGEELSLNRQKHSPVMAKDSVHWLESIER